jgi:hypothetical protein
VVPAPRQRSVDECGLTLKPEIPETGDYGIPLRDELELSMDLGPRAEG